MRSITAWIAFLWLSLIPSFAATHLEMEGAEPLHVSHAQGVVVNSEGKAVADAEIALTRNDRVIAATKTDEAGRFDFARADGRYTLRIKPTNYSAVTREIVVGEAATALMHRNQLYVIVGPGACDDECSSVYTSKRDFEQTIRSKRGNKF